MRGGKTFMEYMSSVEGLTLIGEVSTGCSLSRVMRVRSKGTDFFLKYSDDSEESARILRECRVFEEMSGKLPLPRLRSYGTYNNMTYMLTHGVSGKSAAELCKEYEPERMMMLLCAAMAGLHSVDISHCPIINDLDKKLFLARERMLRGAVDESDFDKKRQGMSAREIFVLLLKNRPEHEDSVFTHGDFCLPNIMFDAAGNVVFIDMGGAGIACRYQDIALMLRSFQYNYGIVAYETVAEMFEKHAAIQIDAGLVEYYQALDEMF